MKNEVLKREREAYQARMEADRAHQEANSGDNSVTELALPENLRGPEAPAAVPKRKSKPSGKKKSGSGKKKPSTKTETKSIGTTKTESAPAVKAEETQEKGGDA